MKGLLVNLFLNQKPKLPESLNCNTLVCNLSLDGILKGFTGIKQNSIILDLSPSYL